MIDPFQFWITIAALVLSVAAVAALSWLERRPRTSLTPRLLPTTPFIILFGLFALMALVHLGTLYGIKLSRR